MTPLVLLLVAVFLPVSLGTNSTTCVVDLTLQAEAGGTVVVDACIDKISASGIFTSNDQQMLRRIAYVETRDGTNSSTYSDPNNDGGIWQLSSTKFTATKNTGNLAISSLITKVSTEFNITWTSVQWSDLRKPFYSAIAARLYLEVITASIPLASQVSSQGSYWVNYYTSSGGTQSDYVDAVNELVGVDCNVNGLELFFVTDSSGSVGSSNYQLMKSFIYDITDTFEIGPNNVQVGVLSYGSSYYFRFYLNTYSNKADVLSAINSLPYSGGGTNTAGALDAIRYYAFTEANGARPASEGIPKVVIVITDGYSNSYSATVTAATALHNEGYIVFAIGIAGANLNELNAIASDPSYVAFISSFDTDLLSSLQVTISQEACVASPSVALNNTISDTLGSGQLKHINFPITEEGITIKLHIHIGKATLYISSSISTPSEAFYDAVIETDEWGDIYLGPEDLCTANADTVYITIVGENFTNVTNISVSATNGDVSTDPVTLTTMVPAKISEYFGESIVVDCAATGKPTPVLTWYKDGVELSSSNGLTITNTTNGSYVQRILTISSLIDADEGIYKCIATNKLPNGTVTQSSLFELDVIGFVVTNLTGDALSSNSIHLSWNLPNQPGLSEETQYYIVHCIEVQSNDEWTFFAVKSHATIISLLPYNYYKCRVAIVGNVTYQYSHNVTVMTLQAAPKSSPTGAAVSIQSSTTILYSWSAPPSEDHNGIIQYYKILVIEIDTNTTFEFTSITTSRFINTLHPHYSYTIQCAAVTVAPGPYTSKITTMMPEDAPSSPPTDVQASAIDSTTLLITWQEPPSNDHNGIIREYDINILEVNTGVNYYESTLNLSISINYLHPHYYYNITVRAVTIYNGPYSQDIIIQMPEAAPTESPHNFNGSASSPYSALLTWSPPSLEYQNGIITSYTINVTIIETGQQAVWQSNTTSLTVNSLHPHRTYECIIAAVTSAGTGPFSTHITITTPEDAPSAPPSITTATSITSSGFTLHWNAPSFDNQNGVITHYEITAVEVETGNIYNHTSYTTSISLMSLHPAYTYQCRVAAHTVALGPFTTAFVVTTDEDVPSQSPQGFSGSSVSSTSYYFSWSAPPPEHQNGVIISYGIVLTAVNGGAALHFTTNDTQFTATGLKPYTIYSCVVAAQTSIGIGPYSSVLTIISDESAPSSAPKITSSYYIDSTSVAIQWTAPPSEDQNGVIRKYLINVTAIDTGKKDTYIFTGTTAIIASLIPSFTYEFTLSAYTVASGPYSNVTTITLPEDVPSGFPQHFSGNATSSTSMYLSWSPPLLEEQSGDIFQYVINVTHADTLETVQHYSVTTYISIDGLDPFTTYVCVVAAETAQGLGPYSHLLFIQTHETSPDSAPLHPNGVALSSTSIYITWDPPDLDDHNGVIREYRINVTESETLYFNQHTTNQTKIVISDLKPYHTYHCYVAAVTVDQGPFTSKVTVVTEEDAPAVAPDSVNVTILSSTSISIAWSPPPATQRNGIIREYSIQVYNPSTDATLEYTTLSTTFNVSVLSPYTQYGVAVAAVTVATGPYSDYYNITTHQDVPSSSPQALNSTSIDSSTLLLMWAPPIADDINGIIQHYNVTVTDTETDTIASTIITTSTSISISGLHPFYVYEWSVFAVTIGPGPSATMTVQMPEDVPSGAPNDVQVVGINSTSITLSWNAPSAEEQNGIIRYYYIIVTDVSTGNASSHVTSLQEEVTLIDLTPYTDYDIAIAAYTIGEGPYSASISITTDEDVPTSSPTSLSSFVTGPREVDLQWSPPPLSEHNGIIIGYTVSILNFDDGNETVQLSSNATSITIDSLLPYTTYKCAIAAYTSVGHGPFTAYDICIFKTEEDAPSLPPEDFLVTEVTSTSIYLSWDLPSKSGRNGIVRSYIVKKIQVNNGVTTYHNATTSTFTATSLHPYYVYNFSVAAVTVATGVFSDVLSVTTDEEAPSASPTSISLVAIDSTTINASWGPPPDNQTNGLIRYYMILLTEINTLTDLVTEASDTSILLSDLHPYYTYTFLVSAVTIESGPYSLAYTIQTPEDAPSEGPRKVSVTYTSPSSVTIEWSPPQLHNQNGVIRFYAIELLSLEDGTEEYYNSTSTHLALSDLHPYYYYDINLYAVTVAHSPATNNSFQMPEDVPTGPPNNVSLIILDPWSIALSWTEPDHELQNGVIRNYSVVVLNSDKETIQSITEVTTNLNISALKPYTIYHVQVAANTVGVGPYSKPLMVQMPESTPSAGPSGLLAEVVANLTLHVSWMSLPEPSHNGILLGYNVVCTAQNGHSTSQQVSDTSATLHDVVANTHYTCLVCAYTSIGCGPNAVIHIGTFDHSPVGPPTSLDANTTTDSIMLRWQPPFDPYSDITSYELRYHLTSTSLGIETPRPEVVVTNIDSPWYTITDLLEDSTYTIAVHAVTSEGLSSASDELVVATNMRGPYAPQGLSCSATSSRELSCSWEGPHVEDYDVSYYSLRYRLADGFDYYPGYGEQLQYIELPSSTTSYNITNLLPYGGYYIHVSAILTFNGEQGSEPELISTSTEAVITDTEVADASILEMKVEIQSPTSVVISWIPPERQHWRGRIKAYAITSVRFPFNESNLLKREAPLVDTVLVQPIANNPDPSLAQVPLKTEVHVLNGLEESFKYRFTVGIVNEAGSGIMSAPVTEIMPEAAPSGPPEDISVNVTSSSVTVSWSPPNPINANGLITSYHLLFTRVEIEDEILYTFKANTTRYTKNGLHPSENISIIIFASTVEGEGPGSDIVYVLTADAVPDAPRFVSAQQLEGATTAAVVVVTWEPLDDSNGVILGYQIIYTGHGSDERNINGPFTVTVSPLDSNHTFTNLSGGYTYTFKVRAFTSAGYGNNATTFITIPSADATSDRSSDVVSSVSTNIIIGIVVACVVLLIVVTLVFSALLIRSRRKKDKFNIYDDPAEFMRQRNGDPPIPNNPLKSVHADRLSDMVENSNDYKYIVNPVYINEIRGQHSPYSEVPSQTPNAQEEEFIRKELANEIAATSKADESSEDSSDSDSDSDDSSGSDSSEDGAKGVYHINDGQKDEDSFL